MFQSCGCKICKKELGETVNQLNIDGYSPNDIIDFLKNENLEVSKKLLIRHLSAYGLNLNDEKVKKDFEELEPIKIEMNNFDFSKYDFEETNPVSIVGYLQKLHLKIHLNQAEILLKLQNDVIEGKVLDIPHEALKNIAVTWKLLSDVSGITVYSNQQSAIKTIENMGLKIDKFDGYSLNKADDKDV